MGAVKAVSGISQNTYKRMNFDAGALYIDYDLPGQKLIGATRGGSTFTIEPENREMTVDGAPGPVKGSQRRLRTTIKLATNVIEMTKENMLLLLPGATSTANGTHDVITRDTQIADTDYITNIALVVEKAGTTELTVLKIENALALNNFEFAAAEDDETVLAIEFTAHYDATTLGTEPWSISNPLETGITSYTITYVAGANGAIIGDTVQSIASGADATSVYAAPDALYEFVDWDDASTDNPRTDTAIGATATYTATFSLI